MRVQLTRPGGPYALAAGMVIGLPLCNLVSGHGMGWNPGSTLLAGAAVSLLAVLLLVWPIQRAALAGDPSEGDFLQRAFGSKGLAFLGRLALVALILLLFLFFQYVVETAVAIGERHSESAGKLRHWLGPGAITWLVLPWLVWTLGPAVGGVKAVARLARLFNLLALVVLGGLSLLFWRFAPRVLPSIQWFEWSEWHWDSVLALWCYLVGVAFLIPVLVPPEAVDQRRLRWVIAGSAAATFVFACLATSGAFLAFQANGNHAHFGWTPHTLAIAGMVFVESPHINVLLVLLATGILPVRLMVVGLMRLLAPWTQRPRLWALGVAATFLGGVARSSALRLGLADSFLMTLGTETAFVAVMVLSGLAALLAVRSGSKASTRPEWRALAVGLSGGLLIWGSPVLPFFLAPEPLPWVFYPGVIPHVFAAVASYALTAATALAAQRAPWRTNPPV